MSVESQSSGRKAESTVGTQADGTETSGLENLSGRSLTKIVGTSLKCEAGVTFISIFQKLKKKIWEKRLLLFGPYCKVHSYILH